MQAASKVKVLCTVSKTDNVALPGLAMSSVVFILFSQHLCGMMLEAM